MTWCSSKYFSVDSRFYFGNPLPGEASPKLPRPFLIWEVWTVTFSQKLPVGTGEVTAKKSLTRPSLLVFLHAGLFLVKLSQKKVHWFWKKLWKNYHQWIQVPHYNLHQTIFAAHGWKTQGLTMLVFPSHAASWRVASSFTLTQGYVQNLQSGQAARWMVLVKLPWHTITSPYAACISALHHRLGMVSAPFSCQACNSLFLSLFLLAWVFIQMLEIDGAQCAEVSTDLGVVGRDCLELPACDRWDSVIDPCVPNMQCTVQSHA